MAKLSFAQTSFTGGELSPRVMGHTDVDRYGSGLKRALNCHPVLHGGLKRRAGTLHLGDAQGSPGVFNASVLVPFVQGRDLAWMLEFSANAVKIWDANGAPTGITLTTPFSAPSDYAQSDSTLYLFTGFHAIHRLQRLDGGEWVLSEAPFTTVPFAEVGFRPTAVISLSNFAVGSGRTATTSVPVWVAADVGRAVIRGGGIGVITAVASSTSATLEITRAFSGLTGGVFNSDWTIEGSPQTDCTPSADKPVGASITLMLGAAGWRAGDFGSMVRINGGLCKITNVSSATVADATIVRELAGITAAPSLAWSLEPRVWSLKLGYPRTGTVHQQRLIAAGTERFPRTVWGSRTGEPLDFELGTDDDLAFAFTVDADESSPISYVSSGKQLSVFSQSAEYSMRSGVEKGLTPTNVRIVPESGHGTAAVRPVSINSETVFVQRAGRKVRSFGYRYDQDGYNALDISSLAEHLTASGVVWMAYQQEPDQLLWGVRADGRLISCTIDRDQNPAVIGWAEHHTDGAVECVACIPHNNADQVWLIVRRTINGVVKRYVERFDHQFTPIIGTESPVYGATVDCAKVFTNAAGQSTFSVPHLAGKTIDVLADGSALSQKVVAADGSVTIDRPGKRVMLGLPFESRATLLNPEIVTQQGSAQGQPARTGQMVLRFLDTIGAVVENSQGGQQVVPFRRFGVGVLDQAPQPFTGLLRVTLLGWERGESEISIIQRQPYPMHLLAAVRAHQVNP